MSEISYFQKFSQRENHATNNTLLVLRHLYRYSPFKFQTFLMTLLDNEEATVDIGPNFIQQVREKNSVPDGCIHQSSFAIFIEAKTHAALDKAQIEAHFKSIASKQTKAEMSVLMTLTTDAILNADIKTYEDLAKSYGLSFTAKTFLQVVEELKAQCRDHEEDLSEIIADYEDFLRDSNLLYSRNEILVAVPCGTSLKENITHGVYYDPATRSPKTGMYLGFYKDKCISMIGKIKGTVICTLENKKLNVIEKESGSIDITDHERIIRMIKESTYYPHLAFEPHRYYVLESKHETNFRKLTTGGMRGHTYFNLSVLGMKHNDVDNAELVANFLRDKTF